MLLTPKPATQDGQNRLYPIRQEPANRQNNDVSHINNFQRSLVRLGHGAFGPNFSGHVPDGTISNLMAQTRNNPVLNEAYKILEAADFVNIQDPILLAHYIKHNRNESISDRQVIRAIEHDETALENVRQKVIALGLGGSFADQVKHLTPNGILDRSIKFIRQNPEICDGKIPGEVSQYYGNKMLVLRTALFYTAKLQQGLSSEFKSLLTKLGGFFVVKPYNNSRIKNLLNDTNITIDGKLYVPANSYVLFADSTRQINQEIGNLTISFEPGRQTRTLNMHFGDCTGFVSEIVRKLRSDLPWFRDNCFKSRDLEIAYDVMVKEQTGCYQYNCLGRTRALTRAEISRIENEFMGRPKLNALKAGFQPVLNRDDIKADDIVVYRQRPNGNYSTGTGHGVIVVDPRPSRSNPNLITVVECNIGSSAIHGYGWRNDTINSRGIWETRVLRIRNV